LQAKNQWKKSYVQEVFHGESYLNVAGQAVGVSAAGMMNFQE